MSLSSYMRARRRLTEVEPESLKSVLQPVCTTCSAIPLEIFQSQPLRRTDRFRGAPWYLLDEDLLDEERAIVDVPTKTGDCCYQHYSGSDALTDMSRSAKQGCSLCVILWFSLQASRQSLPKAMRKTPTLPARLPTETGITLHSFDNDHFIVRDETRWSLVRFSRGNRVNEKGLKS